MEERIKEFKKKAKFIYNKLAFIMLFPIERKKNIPHIVKAIQEIEELLKHIKDQLNLYMKVTSAESHFNQASDEFELKKEEQKKYIGGVMWGKEDVKPSTVCCAKCKWFSPLYFSDDFEGICTNIKENTGFGHIIGKSNLALCLYFQHVINLSEKIINVNYLNQVFSVDYSKLDEKLAKKLLALKFDVKIISVVENNTLGLYEIQVVVPDEFLNCTEYPNKNHLLFSDKLWKFK